MEKLRSFFGIEQKKIGRKKYLFANISAFSIYWCILFVAGTLYDQGGTVLSVLMGIVMLFFGVGLLYIYIESGFNRLDDIRVSRWSLLLSFVPYVNAVFFIYLCLKKGEGLDVTSETLNK